MLYPLSYQANWEVVVIWADDKPVDDGYRSIDLMLIHEFHVLELRIEIDVYDPRNF